MSRYIRIKNIPYLNKELNYHSSLNEIARIDSPKKDQLPGNIKIYVYSEKDSTGTKVPHFHVISEDFEFEIYIKHINDLNIWRTIYIDKKTNLNTWDERTDIRDAIKEWLSKSNVRIPAMTNAEVIVQLWNMSNDNEIDMSYKD